MLINVLLIALIVIAVLAVMILFASPFFYPSEYLNSTYEIDFDKLYKEGYRGVIFDIDNTLVEHGYPADDRSKELLKHLHEIGFSVTFLSNNKEPRVKSFRDAALPDSNYIYKAGKPMKTGYLKAMDDMSTNESDTIFVGDQLFTDVWGARRCKLYSILVRPINPKEEIQIILKRRIEWIVLFRYKMTENYTQKPHELLKNS